MGKLVMIRRWVFRKNLRCLFTGAIICFLLILQFIGPDENRKSYQDLNPTRYQLSQAKEYEYYPEVWATGQYKQYEQKDWQSTGHPDYKVWIYSAYANDDDQVVIMASPLPTIFHEDSIVQCAFHGSQFDDGMETTTKKTKAELELMLGERWPKGGTFIRCPLPDWKPGFVSVLLASQTESGTRLPIKYQNLKGTQRPFQFAVCVLPLYRYKQVFHLVEWVEFYKMMGAHHFTFYNRSIRPATSCVLNHYTSNTFDGVTVKVNPWHNYPQRSDLSQRGEEAEGKAPAINDCFYSHRGLSKYMIYVDVDELIVPSQEGITDYHQLFQYLEKTIPPPVNGDMVGEYGFRNGFYFKFRDTDPQLLDRCNSGLAENFEIQVCKQLWTMKHVRREPLTNEPAEENTERQWKNRTKYIAIPEAVRNGDCHSALELEKGWARREVDGDIAFSRHYRNTNRLGVTFSKSTVNTTVERIPLEMGLKLAKNVSRRMAYFMKVCDMS